jgi:hypothetical protein
MRLDFIILLWFTLVNFDLKFKIFKSEHPNQTSKIQKLVNRFYFQLFLICSLPSKIAGDKNYKSSLIRLLMKKTENMHKYKTQLEPEDIYIFN